MFVIEIGIFAACVFSALFIARPVIRIVNALGIY